MTSWQSLLACAQADVTLDRITALAAVTGTEPLTVEFKEQASPRTADSIAAMANTYGGLIFIGIRDSDHEIIGVKAETMAHVTDMLTARLDPADYSPEMFEVKLGEDKPDRYVLVIRVRYENAPRPVLVQRTIGSGHDKTNMFWMPVRRPGGNRQATRAEMAALFAEQPGSVASEDGWNLHAPRLPASLDRPNVDYMLKTGLFIAPGPAAPGRPLSERVIDTLCAALNKSPLAQLLVTLTRLTTAGVYDFRRRGIPNTSTTATLTWSIAGEPTPFDVMVRIEAPGQYGHSHIQTVQVTLEVTSRLTAWMHSAHAPVLAPPGTRRRLEPEEWGALLDSMVATLTDDQVAGAFADLADVHPILVPQPRILHITSAGEMAGFLPPQLQPIPDAGGAHGAHLLADPVLDLSDEVDRAQQVKRWLCQVAADAGLRGMEALVSKIPDPGTSA